MVNVMDKKEFDEWVTKMFVRKPKHYSCWQLPGTKMVICVNEKNGKVGVARCHPNDKFKISHGKAIAIARCAGIEVPTIDIEKPVCELKNGDHVRIGNVERIFIGRIIVGKYVFSIPDTITTKVYTFNEYDVVTVIE